MTWLLLLVVALGCASQDQQQQASQRETVGSVSQAVVTTCGSSAVPATTTWVQPGYTIWQNHDSFIVPVGSAPTDNLDVEFTEPSGITGVYVNWLCVRAYLRSTTGNITYLGTSTVTAGTHTCATGTCLRRVSYDMSAVTPGTYEVLLAADDQNTTFLRRTIDVLEATFPPVQYRQVTYARDIDEYFAFPTLTPPATPLFSPELRRPNHFIFNVPTRRAVALQVDVGNSAAALDLVVTDTRRTVIKSTAVPSSVTGHQLTAVSLGTLNPGNYELDLAPRNEAQTYKVSSGDAAIPIALKDGADLAQPGTSLYFFVPAEAETVFLLGAFDSTSAARFFSPEANGPEVTPVSIGSGVYALDTRGKPGIWRTTYQTTASRAHFINLPEVYSFDPNAAIASTRIRTAMDLGPVLSSSLELPYLRADNHFVFHVATAASPSFNIAVEDSSLPSATLSVKLLDSSGGNLWTGSLPVGATNPVSAGLLQPGDYELQVKNPNGSTRYLVTVPAGITFASVDDVRVGNIWLARYRQYFTVSAGAPPIRFFADGSGAIFTIYKPDGTAVGQPTALGHNLYDIPNPGAVYGTWAMNVKGATNVRFLNVPQVIGWNPTFQASLPPTGIIQCTTTANCPTGQVCGTDNGAQFGLAATADVCWLPTCCTNQQPPNSSGTILSQCGTCPATHCMNGVKDAAETDVDCGGECSDCSSGKGCGSDADCATGLACGVNNGGHFGRARADDVCWDPSCNSDPSDCGQANSKCGPSCPGATACDPSDPNAICPLGEVCKGNLATLFDLGAGVTGACVDPSCPSNDPAKCGTESSLCGRQCICTPDCSAATAANPDNRCGGTCPHLCALGQQCCTTDLECPVDAFCQAQPTGVGICRPKSCAYQRLEPPLCGSANSACGQQCPVCTPQCAGRQCGLDAECGASCGECATGQFCDGNGQCQASGSSDPPIQVLDGAGEPIDIPNLAQASTAPVGALSGRFSVSDDGSAQYSVAIDVPPGRAGVEPVLSLQYIGAKSMAEAGVGWKLEGLSEITRCPRSYALDHYSAPIRGDETDRFCLDGKRLELAPGSAGYGQNGADYRTLIDSFNKVRSWKEAGGGFQPQPWPNVPIVAPGAQGPDYFEVWTKDGRKLTYGRTRDAVLIARNGVRIAWLLNRVEDRSGNSMLVRYNNFTGQLPPQLADKAASVIEPQAIFYTGHGGAEGDREVRFNYELRSDWSVNYAQGGVPVVNPRRLKRITTYVKGEAVKHYRLKYDPGQTSLVREIRECFHNPPDTDESTCKPPTVFDYAQESGFSAQNLNFGRDVSDVGQLDMNGDGLPDFLVTTAHVGPTPQLGLGWKVAFTVVDVGVFAIGLVASPGGSMAANMVWTGGRQMLQGALAGNPAVTFTSDVLQGTGNRNAPVTVLSNVSGMPCPSGHSIFLDYDQDGKDDIVGSCSPYSVFVARSIGNGNFEAPRDVSNWPYPDLGAYSRPWPMLYDVDGNGLHDVVTCYSKSKLEVRLRQSPNAALGQPITLLSASPNQRLPFCGDGVPTAQVMDVDGDGTAELLVRYQPQDADKNNTYFETGWYVLRYSASTPQLRWDRIKFPDVGDSATGRSMQGVDLNGDGLMDFWRPGDNDGNTNAEEATIWLNSGNGFIASSPHRPVPARTMDPQSRLSNWVFADHDADGRFDIVENWAHNPAISYLGDMNVVLRPNPALSDFEASLPNDLVPEWFSDLAASRYTMVGDLDADGNPDLFGSSGTAYYGSGIRNMLLSKVTDGLGNTVHVNYEAFSSDPNDDAEPATYKATCTGGEWPVRCVKNMRGLVSSHSEGFVDLDAPNGEILERTYHYKYENARIDVAGHGWLGFDKRVVSEGGRTVTVEFEPASRYKLDGTAATDTGSPYLYPLAGLPHVTTVDQVMSPLTDRQSSIEDGPHSRRTKSTQEWAVQMSAGGRPFPVLALTTTESFSREAVLIGQVPFGEDGELRTKCFDENRRVDTYGNVEENLKSCDYEAYDSASGGNLENLWTKTTYFIDPENWLVANTHTVTIVSTHADASQTQNFESTYYANGLLQSVTRDPAGDAQRVVYGRDPDGFGTVVRVTETESSGEAVRTTDVTYDSDHYFPTSITKHVGGVDLTTQVAFEPYFGQLATMADPNGVSVQYAYDAFGKRRKATGATGTTEIDYAAIPFHSVETPAGVVHPRLEVSSNSVSPSNQFAGHTVEQLDNYGRTVQSATVGFDGADLLSETAFDVRGRVTRATAPHLAAAPVIPSETYTYDYLDRVISVENADGSFSERQYASGVSLASARQNWLSGLVCQSPRQTDCAVDIVLSIGTHDPDEPGEQGVAILDHAGRVVRTIDGEHVADGAASSEYIYGPFERLNRMLDNAGTMTAFAYDPYGRLRTHTDPDGGSTTYTYTGFGDLKTSSRNGGRTYHHDTLGRLTSIDDNDGTTRWNYDQGVSALGRLSETISPPSTEAPNGQHVVYNYEPMTQQQRRGLLSSIEYVLDDTSYTVGMSYDEQARLDRVAYPVAGGGTPIVAQYHYQAASGALESVTESGSGVEHPIWHLDEAFEGQLARVVTFGNGAVTTFGYNSAQRWLDFASTSLGNEVVQDLVYDHYSNGQLLDRREPNRSEEYTYDPLGRLHTLTVRATGMSETTKLFGYDAHGNLAQNDSVTNSFDNPATPHLPTSVGGNTYAHYPNGNLFSRTGGDVPGGTQLFTYTPFDLPRSITDGTAQHTTQFEYTADEERVVRRDPDTTRYQVGGLYEHLVSSTSGTTLEERFRISAGGSVVAEIVRSDGADHTLFFHTDHLGTPETITDNAGNVTKQTYAPFGARQGGPPAIAGIGTRVGFTSQHQDDDLGLVDMHGRIFDPLAGRFTTADPIMQAPFFSQGQNRYAYVLNDPINMTDPSGMAFDTSGDVFAQGHVVGDSMTAGALGFTGGALAYGIGSELGIGAAVAEGVSSMPETIQGAVPGALARNVVNVVHIVQDVVGLVANDAPSGARSDTVAPPKNTHKTKSGAQHAKRQNKGQAPVQERMPPAGGASGPSADPLRTGDPKNGPGLNLQYDPEKYAYRLSRDARILLQPLFDNFHFDLNSQITIAFGGPTSTNGNSAFTVGNSVIVNRDVWDALTPREQRGLLAHELTHSVQYREIGYRDFAARYAKEYPKYGVPPELANIPINSLNPVDPRFSLDQIGDRVRAEYLSSPFP